MNNLIRQEEEEKAKEMLPEEKTSVTKPRRDGILKHHQDTIKEEAFQPSIKQDEGEDAQEPVVKPLNQTHNEKEDEEEANKASVKRHDEECSNVAEEEPGLCGSLGSLA